MDGVILDQAFDNQYWQISIPEAVSKKNKITLAEAQKIVFQKSKELFGTLDWYRLEYWENFLGIDLIEIAIKNKEYIQFIYKAEQTLRYLNRSGYELFLLTNCDARLLKIKDSKLDFLKYFKSYISSVDIGIVKEDIRFWKEVLNILDIDKERAIFLDDNLEVIKASKKSGIKNSLYVLYPSNDKNILNKEVSGFKSIKSLSYLA